MGLREARKKKSRLAPVLLEYRAERAGEQPLFSLRFPHETSQNNRKRDDPAVASDRQSGPQNRRQHAGVDRVANPGVRPSANQLMAGAEGDAGAPILCDVIARPNGEGHAGPCEHGSKDEYPVSLGNKSPIEDAESRIIVVQEDKG